MRYLCVSEQIVDSEEIIKWIEEVIRKLRKVKAQSVCIEREAGKIVEMEELEVFGNGL
ncbi:MAG: hypothetical protein WCR55_14930 [Lentisphaerota bacterium]